MFMFFFFFNEPATTEIYTYVHSFPTRLSSDLQDQVIEDEGADAVSDGEAAEEEGGDRRPGEPIGPIEDRPLAMPAGVDVEAEVALQECPKIVSDAAQRQAEHVGGRAGEQDEGDDREENPGVEDRKAGNALLQAGRRRDEEARDDRRRDRPAQRGELGRAHV